MRKFDGGKENDTKDIFIYKKQAYSDMLKKYSDVKDAIKEAQKERYGFLKPMRLGEQKQPKELLPRQ